MARPASPPTRPTADAAGAAAATRLDILLIAATLVPAAALAICRVLDVGGLVRIPLGCPGRFTYLYTPLLNQRLSSVPQFVACAVLIAAGFLAQGHARRAYRRGGAVLIVIGVLLLGAWTYLAPPEHFKQHLFNGHSPSQDGAFVQEAIRIEAVAPYLANFPQRAALPPAELRGTRVVSNPPGATLLARAANRTANSLPSLRNWALGPELTSEDYPPAVLESTATAMLFFIALTSLWTASAGVLYFAGRALLGPVDAAAYAVCCFAVPGALLFTPGKDPAQLFTVAVPLALWLRAVYSDGGRRAALFAALTGIAATLTLLVSLVHLWVGAILFAATALDAWRRGQLRRLAMVLLPSALVAGLVTTFALWLLCGINLIAITRAVAAAQTGITSGPDAMPYVWQLLGIPLFLLLAGPAWWALTIRATRRSASPRRALGRDLLLLTAVVLVATVGFTNVETPRLWLPFMPLWLLGAWLRWRDTTTANAPANTASPERPQARPPAPHPGLRYVPLAALVCAQIVGATLLWSLLDARESEHRLLDETFFDRPATVDEAGR